MQSQCTSCAPIVNPLSSGHDGPTCPCCNAPVVMAWDEVERCETAYCCECGYAWADAEPCGQVCDEDVPEASCPF